MLAATVMDAALKHLNRRAYSKLRLEELLLKDGYSKTQVSEALQRLLSWGYLNDRELGVNRILTLQAKLKSRAYIETDLARLQLAIELINDLLKEHYPDQLELAIAKRLIARGSKTISLSPERTWRLLARSGFSETTIEACLSGISPT